jgi:hypothetical protein
MHASPLNKLKMYLFTFKLENIITIYSDNDVIFL